MNATSASPRLTVVAAAARTMSSDRESALKKALNARRRLEEAAARAERFAYLKRVYD